MLEYIFSIVFPFIRVLNYSGQRSRVDISSRAANGPPNAIASRRIMARAFSRDCTISAIECRHIKRDRLSSFALFPLSMRPEMIGGQVLLPPSPMMIGGRDVTPSKSSKLSTTVTIVMYSARVKRTALFPPEIFLLPHNFLSLYRARWKFLLLGSFFEAARECASSRDFIITEMKKKEEKLI